MATFWPVYFFLACFLVRGVRMDSEEVYLKKGFRYFYATANEDKLVRNYRQDQLKLVLSL